MQEGNPGPDGTTSGITSNGVPFVAIPPDRRRTPRGLVLLWHGADPPRSEQALAAAVPLRRLDCWRVYLGMPLYGRRSPPGGFKEIMRLGAEDALTLIFQPSIQGAVDELPAALDDIRARFHTDPSLPLGLFGFSQRGAAARLTLSRGRIPFRAAVTVGAVIDLGTVVDGLSAIYGTPYEWTAKRREIADSLSSVHSAPALAAGGAALLLAVGAEDPYPMRKPAEGLAAQINSEGGLAELRILAGIPHAFVEPPGEQPAPQGAMARLIDETAGDWFTRHLFYSA